MAEAVTQWWNTFEESASISNWFDHIRKEQKQMRKRGEEKDKEKRREKRREGRTEEKRMRREEKKQCRRDKKKAHHNFLSLLLLSHT